MTRSLPGEWMRKMASEQFEKWDETHHPRWLAEMVSAYNKAVDEIVKLEEKLVKAGFCPKCQEALARDPHDLYFHCGKCGYTTGTNRPRHEQYEKPVLEGLVLDTCQNIKQIDEKNDPRPEPNALAVLREARECMEKTRPRPSCDLCHGTGRIISDLEMDGYETRPCPKCFPGTASGKNLAPKSETIDWSKKSRQIADGVFGPIDTADSPASRFMPIPEQPGFVIDQETCAVDPVPRPLPFVEYLTVVKADSSTTEKPAHQPIHMHDKHWVCPNCGSVDVWYVDPGCDSGKSIKWNCHSCGNQLFTEPRRAGEKSTPRPELEHSKRSIDGFDITATCPNCDAKGEYWYSYRDSTFTCHVCGYQWKDEKPVPRSSSPQDMGGNRLGLTRAFNEMENPAPCPGLMDFSDDDAARGPKSKINEPVSRPSEPYKGPYYVMSAKTREIIKNEIEPRLDPAFREKMPEMVEILRKGLIEDMRALLSEKHYIGSDRFDIDRVNKLRAGGSFCAGCADWDEGKNSACAGWKNCADYKDHCREKCEKMTEAGK